MVRNHRMVYLPGRAVRFCFLIWDYLGTLNQMLNCLDIYPISSICNNYVAFYWNWRSLVFQVRVLLKKIILQEFGENRKLKTKPKICCVDFKTLSDRSRKRWILYFAQFIHCIQFQKNEYYFVVMSRISIFGAFIRLKTGYNKWCKVSGMIGFGCALEATIWSCT